MAAFDLNLMRLRSGPSITWRGWTSVLSVGVLLFIWELAARTMVSAGGVSIFFPSFSKVLLTGFAMVRSSEFWWAVLVSNLRVLTGFLLAAALAIPMGVFLGAFPRAGA